jgi:hypothetical protein
MTAKPALGMTCSTCGQDAYLRRRSAHSADGDAYEIQSFACRACKALTTRRLRGRLFGWAGVARRAEPKLAAETFPMFPSIDPGGQAPGGGAREQVTALAGHDQPWRLGIERVAFVEFDALVDPV